MQPKFPALQAALEVGRTDMIFLVAQIGNGVPKQAATCLGAPAGSALHGGPRRLLPLGPHPEPDPRLCLGDDLSCRQSIGSSSGGREEEQSTLCGRLSPPRRGRLRDPLRNSRRRPPADSRVMSSRRRLCTQPRGRLRAACLAPAVSALKAGAGCQAGVAT